jgi:lysophospholipase L1-like esterase
MKNAIAILALALSFTAQAESWPDWIKRYEDKIIAFEKQPKPPTDGVVFAGNSNFTLWPNLEKDMAPLPAIKRGFGGSTTVELRYYADRALLNLGAKTFVIQEGENDFGRAFSSDGIVSEHQKLIAKIRAKRADSTIVIVGLKPSPMRWYQWEKFLNTNIKLAKLCAGIKGCTFVDISPAVMKNGKVDATLFREDTLHFNDAGVAKVRAILKPAVEAVHKTAQPECCECKCKCP